MTLPSEWSTWVAPIHEAALVLLERTGIVLDEPGMRQRLADAGCRVEGRRVRIPGQLVEGALRQVPAVIELYRRDGSPALSLSGPGQPAGNGRIHITNSGVAPHIRDLDSGQRRPSTLDDVGQTTRLLDALPGIDVLCATLVEPGDVPPALTILRGFEATLRNTLKPISGPGVTNAGEARLAIAMGVAVRGSLEALQLQPFFMPWMCPVSPLTFGADLVLALVEVARAGLPLAVVSAPVLGLSSPLTAAGALAQIHAELLAALVMAYQMRPGLPFLYQASFARFDMQRGQVGIHAPEQGLLKGISVLLARHCALPATAFGLESGAKGLDARYGYEKSTNGLLGALAQPALLGGVGLFNNGLDASCEAIVVDHEIAGMLLHGLRGVEVNAETLGLQVIAEVLDGGDFLTHPHTLRHLRDGERWPGSLAENDSFDEWVAAGRRTAADRANEQARALLAAHQVPALDPAAEEHLQAVLAEAEQRLGAANSGRRRP